MSPITPEKCQPRLGAETLPAGPDAPQDPEALASLGKALMRSSDFQGAARAFGSLLEVTGGAAWAHNLLGVSLIMGGNAQEAGQHFAAAVEQEPEQVLFRTNLGKCLATQKRWAEGMHHLRQALEANPGQVDSEVLETLNLCRRGLNLEPLRPEDLAEGLPRSLRQGETCFPDPTAPPQQAPPKAPRETAPPPAARAKARPSATACKMAVCCLPNLDHFVGDIIRALKPQVDTRKLVSTDLDHFKRHIAEADTVWLEWGNELAQALTTRGAPWLRGKRVILRIHSYEVLNGIADAIDFSRVDDLIFVGPHIRDILLARKPDIAQKVRRIHVVPNGVDVDRFALARREPGYNIAYLGSLNFKKDPMVLMQAFRSIYARDRRYRLHLGGKVEELRYLFAIEHFERQNGLEGALAKYGHVEDVPAWLQPMNYIICSSLMEGHPVGLLEAMATGCQPLIYHWPGAAAFYPPEFLWSNHDELWDLLGQRLDPAQVREFVVQNYSLEIQVERLRRIILDEETIEFQGFRRPAIDPPSIPQGCFSPHKSQRIQANRDFGLRLAGDGFLDKARVFLERAWWASACRDGEAGQALLELHQRRGRWEEMGHVLKEQGFQAARRRDYETMLESFYAAYYMAYMHTRSYQYMRYDPAIDAVLELAARDIQPLAPPAGLLEGLDPTKTRVAIGLEGFDLQQAPPRMICDLGKGLATQGLEVIFLTRLALQPAWEPAIRDLEQAGCKLLRLPEASQVDKLRLALGAIRQAGCKAFLVQTPWLVPWLNLLAMCRPAPHLIKIPNQQGGWETQLDQVVLQNEPAVINEAQEGILLGVPFQGDPLPPQPLPPRKPGQLKLLVVGRVPKLGHRLFWEALGRALAENKGLSISVAGATAEELPQGLAPRDGRLRFLGFRRDVPQLMKKHHLVLDTWPTGGGSVIFEALSVGRPVISFRTNWYQHRQADQNVYNHLVHPELLQERLEPRDLAELLARLAREPGLLERLHRECLSIKLVEPREYHRRLADSIRGLAEDPGQAGSGGAR